MKRRARLFTRLAVIFLLAGCAVTPEESVCRIDFEPLDTLPAISFAGLDTVPRANHEREELVYHTFNTMGCNVERQKLPYRKSGNVICKVPGISDETILIAAHHDRLGSGQGVADNWTGVSMLTALAQHYLLHQPVHTMTFVAFADEEDDMKGAYHYVRQLDQSNQATPRLMLNLDTLGVGMLQIEHHSTEPLACVARAAALSLNISVGDRRYREMSGDWEPFKRAGVPMLSFHSLDKRTLQMLHTYRDRRDLVDDQLLMDAYRVIANTLSAFDYGVDLVTTDRH